MMDQVAEFGKVVSWNDIQPHKFYTDALLNNPVVYDDTVQSWIIYSYNDCKSVFLSEAAEIPPAGANNPSLSHQTKALLLNMARLSNNGAHAHSRNAAFQIAKTMQPASVAELMNDLIPEKDLPLEIDWISAVCKKLPVLFLAKGLGFNNAACQYIICYIGELVKIMSPKKTTTGILSLNKVAESFAMLAEDLLQTHALLSKLTSPANKDLMVANLLGLLIQSYDAGRGALCNTVIQLAGRNADFKQQERSFFYQSVIETLRFDPPVHHTRRVAVRDTTIGGHQIKKGEQIVLVVAAANLDATVFRAPLHYDIGRTNNSDHLTFGAGGHTCLAKHLMIELVSEACCYLFQRFNSIQIQNQPLSFEPQLNVRLVIELYITLSN